MSTVIEKAELQVTFSKEKLDALRFYMNEKDLTVEDELEKYIGSIYEKYVPAATRRYLERNDEDQQMENEIVASTESKEESITKKSSTGRTKKKTDKIEKELQKEAIELEKLESMKEEPEQMEEESQSMFLTM